MARGRAVLALILLLALSRPVSAQLQDNAYFWSHHAPGHLAVGGGLDLLVRGPWIARPFRDRPWKRVAWACLVTGLYELTQRVDSHGGYRAFYVAGDTAAGCGGALATELLIAGVRKVF